MGLVAAALGIRRDEEERLLELAKGYDIAVVVESAGEPLRDFHTVQVPKTTSGRERFLTRREELGDDLSSLNTIVTTRDYRCDAYYFVLLSPRSPTPPYPLTEIAERLRQPTFVLYLGRKSCPICHPLGSIIITADSVSSAVRQALTALRPPFFPPLKKGSRVRVYSERAPSPGERVDQRISRRDDLSSRKRWQYSVRPEYLMNLEV
jgi:CRISPR system Cascade subunit CasD